MVKNKKSLKCLSVGWDPFLIKDILQNVEKKTDIRFLHALTSDATRLAAVQEQYPELKLISLGKKKFEQLPKPNYTLLGQLESAGVPTVRSMIQGDPYLRSLPERKSLGYATLIAQNLKNVFEKYKPKFVLASNDRLHSAMALAVAKSLNIPFVVLAFPVIPDNLTGFLNALTPNSLVPIVRPVTNAIRQEALSLIQSVRLKRQIVQAYKAPFLWSEYVLKILSHINNLIGRLKSDNLAGLDEYSSPSLQTSAYNIGRRLINRICLPVADMITIPPRKRYAYYPLHMAPESMLDTWAPFYQNQFSFAAQVALAIPSDMEFVVKLHFSDPDNYNRQELKKLMLMPGLRIAHPTSSGRAFLEQAALVVGITGTSCLEAALLGKPVLIFGDSPYQHFPRTERAKRPDELHEQINNLLQKPKPTKPQLINAYSAYLSRYMPGRINDWSKPIKEKEAERLVDCFRALSVFLRKPINIKNWYKQSPFQA